MCGRYTYYSSEDILKQFNLSPNESLQTALSFPDNYNVSPGNEMPIIIRGSQEHVLEYMTWGLIPSWSKQPSTKLKLINARKESLLEKPMWKRLVNSKRCIVPARGFYEWKTLKGQKIPFYITMKDTSVLSFAGLWDTWTNAQGIDQMTFTIITTTPNKEMSKVHDRMPAILTKQLSDIWLDPSILNQEQLEDILSPLPDNLLNIKQVSTDVNNARNNSSDLIYSLNDE